MLALPLGLARLPVGYDVSNATGWRHCKRDSPVGFLCFTAALIELRKAWEPALDRRHLPNPAVAGN